MLSLADWFLLLLIAVCIVLAVRYAWQHRGSCGGCSGCCDKCRKNSCTSRKEGGTPPSQS